MTKKHFEWAAAYVRRLRMGQGTFEASPRDANVIEEAFARLCVEFGPRFDEARFRAACRGEEGHSFGHSIERTAESPAWCSGYMDGRNGWRRMWRTDDPYPQCRDEYHRGADAGEYDRHIYGD